jgi:hypothetical protein
MEEWAKKRLAELEAAAPAKRKKNKPFVKVELGAAAKAFTGMNCPKAMVYLWLVHQVWKKKKNTVAIPNGALNQYGISRKVKYLALQQLEEVGLITVEWRSRKTPVVTLLS